MCAILWYKCNCLGIFCLVSIQKFLLKTSFWKFLYLIKNVFNGKYVNFCLFGKTNKQIKKHLHHLDYVVLFLSGNSINIFNLFELSIFQGPYSWQIAARCSTIKIYALISVLNIYAKKWISSILCKMYFLSL